MSTEVRAEITDLLARWRSGDRRALDALMPVFLEELRKPTRHGQPAPDAMGISLATVKRGWTTACAWLFREMIGAR